MEKMKQYLGVLTKAILAGILIGVAGTIYVTLASDYYIIGVILFGFGLLVILAQGYNLFTGKVGYLVDNPPRYLIDLLIMIIGNFLGGLIVAAVVHLSGMDAQISFTSSLVNSKMTHSWYQIFGLAILCGFLMYLAAEGYRRVENNFARVIIVIFAVSIFLLAGFEHSIADMYYFTVTNTWTTRSIFYLGLMLLGNGLGANLLNILEKMSKLKENVCPISYHDEVKKLPRESNFRQNHK